MPTTQPILPTTQNYFDCAGNSLQGTSHKCKWSMFVGPNKQPPTAELLIWYSQYSVPLELNCFILGLSTATWSRYHQTADQLYIYIFLLFWCIIYKWLERYIVLSHWWILDLERKQGHSHSYCKNGKFQIVNTRWGHHDKEHLTKCRWAMFVGCNCCNQPPTAELLKWHNRFTMPSQSSVADEDVSQKKTISYETLNCLIFRSSTVT